MPEHDDALVKRAIQDAMEVAKNGNEVDGLSATADEITRLVGRFELYLNGVPIEMTKLPVSVTNLTDDQIRTVRDIIDVAARAIRAATADDLLDASSESSDGISWAFSIAEKLGDSELMGRLTESVESLSRYCDTSGVTDKSIIWWTGTQWQSEN
ncbi:MAG: hypothetical protein JXM70_07525 [Pirellulales bacterium]|nr:hypothetical protein [Pirellulales bacterium]